MKYLITFILFLSLISLTSADTTFSDNPNYFTINSYVAPEGKTGTGSTGGTVFVNISNQTGLVNITAPQNFTEINQTVVNQITYVIQKNPFIWIVIIILIIIYFYFRDKEKNKDKKQEEYQVGYFTQ